MQVGTHMTSVWHMFSHTATTSRDLQDTTRRAFRGVYVPMKVGEKYQSRAKT
jgi:hypothetical protein